MAVARLRTVPAQALDDPGAAIPALLAGDESVWPSFAETVHARVIAICRRRRLGAGHPAQEDLHHETALAALERMRANDFAVLRHWQATRAQYPEARFDAWLGAVVGNTFVDRLRASPEVSRRREGGGRRLVAVTAVP